MHAKDALGRYGEDVAARHLIQQGAGRMPGGIRHFVGVSRFSVGILRPYLPAGASNHFCRVPPRPPTRNDGSIVAAPPGCRMIPPRPTT